MLEFAFWMGVAHIPGIKPIRYTPLDVLSVVGDIHTQIKTIETTDTNQLSPKKITR